MRQPYYHPPQYRSDHGVGDKLYLLAWRAAGAVAFRLIPAPLSGFRNALLRLFGASVARTAFIDPTCRVYSPRMLVVGARSCLAARVDCYSVAPIVIGDDVTVSQDAFLCTASHDIDRADRPLVVKPIHLHRGVWVFARAVVLPGVTVGEGAVVAACAVVCRDVACHSVVAGNPARHVRERKFRGASEEQGGEHG